MEETNYRVTRKGDDELKHYGVKGMRWGVRNEPRALTKASGFVKEKEDYRVKAHSNAVDSALKAKQRMMKIVRESNQPTQRLQSAPIKLKADREAAEAYLDRNRRMERLKNSDSPVWELRKALGEDKAIELERAAYRYSESVRDMGESNDELLVVSYNKEGVIQTTNGPFMLVAWDCVNNPGITEKEMIEKMQQRRAALAQAQAAYDATPMGKIESLVNKGKQKVRRFINDIKRKLKNRKK